MNSIAARAVAVAYHVEGKKDSLRQNQAGDWKATFTLAEIPPALIAAPMGTRFLVSLVEIGDDEEPVVRETAVAPPQKAAEVEGVSMTPEAPSTGPAKEKREWKSLKFAQRAALLCNDPVFWQWCNETYDGRRAPSPYIHDTDTAAIELRFRCQIASRSELDKSPDSAERYAMLEMRFLDYKGRGEYMRSAAQ